MFESFTQKQFRLGDLLVEKHLITPSQLTAAIAVQKAQDGVPLGQILIELGYISAGQLRRTLVKQNSLRRLSRVLTLMAISSTGFATTACSPDSSSAEEPAAITQDIGSDGGVDAATQTGAETADPFADAPNTLQADSTVPAPAPAPAPIPAPAPATYNAEVSWTAPTARTDGSALKATDIAYYEIYYTADSNGEIKVIRVTDPTALSYLIRSLPADAYNFSMAVTDKAGIASAMSEAVEVVVR